MAEILTGSHGPDYSIFFEQLDRSAMVADSKGKVLAMNGTARALFSNLDKDRLTLSFDSMKEIASGKTGDRTFPLSFEYPDRKEPLLESIPFMGRIVGVSPEDEPLYYLIIHISSVMEDVNKNGINSGRSGQYADLRRRSPLVWVLDTDFRYVSFNDFHKEEMKSVWGAEIREGDNLLDFLKDERYKRLVVYNYNRALSGEHFYTIDEIKGKDGKSRYFENVLGPWLNDEDRICGLRVRTAELTDPEEVKDRLQLSIAVQRSLIEGYGNIGISSIDRYYRYRAFNDGYRRFMEKARGVKIRIGYSLLDSLPSETIRHEVNQKLKKVFEGESFSEVRSYPLAEGGMIYYQHFYFPVISVMGDVIGITTFSQDVTEKMNREMEVKEALKEKEILLREVHFRVKNNLQMVSSLLSLQIGESGGENDRNFQDLFLRVQTMALIHEQLYQGKSLGKVQSREFFSRIGAMLIEIHNFDTDSISFHEDVEEFELDLDTAIPLGLIYNELLSNSIIHAFSGNEKDRPGELLISLKEPEEGLCCLSVSDRGGFDWRPRRVENEFGLGLKLVSTLTEQLEGKLTFNFSGGTTVNLVFKRRKGA